MENDGVDLDMKYLRRIFFTGIFFLLGDYMEDHRKSWWWMEDHREPSRAVSPHGTPPCISIYCPSPRISAISAISTQSAISAISAIHYRSLQFSENIRTPQCHANSISLKFLENLGEAVRPCIPGRNSEKLRKIPPATENTENNWEGNPRSMP